MADTAYEAECQRAELLGIAKPDYDEFVKNFKLSAPSETVEDGEVLQEVDVTEERLGHVGGGLEELNSILQVTQKKINRFKQSCGSLTNMLKFRLGSTASSSSDSLQNAGVEEAPSGIICDKTEEEQVGQQRKSDLARALDNHVDKLDSLIDKAERAHISMSYQTKEMKKYVRKRLNYGSYH